MLHRLLRKLLRNPFKSGGLLHPVKNRLGRWLNGAGCCDVYSLDHYLAPRLRDCLKIFKERHCSHPTGMTAEEWETTLDEMIWSFDYYSKDDAEFDEALYKRSMAGINLFSLYFENLWY